MSLLQKFGVFFRTKRDRLFADARHWKEIYAAVRFKDRLEREQIDRRAKCPSCGHGGKRGWLLRTYRPSVKVHEIKFSEAHQQVLHECPICAATWGERCLIKPKEWKVVIPDEQTDVTQQIAEG